jgi:succinate-semialdehyde dehydrogenase/glutarate-semialdehyde dehydrogenase
MDTPDTRLAIAAASAALPAYKATTARTRARLLRKWNDLILENADDLALICCLENGKTLGEARGEVVYAASFLEWFAGEAERVGGEVVSCANPGWRVLTMREVSRLFIPRI